MTLDVVWTSRFKKDYKLAISRGKNIAKLDEVITALAEGRTLDDKYRDHALSGNWANHRECHIEPDWLLIYMKREDLLVLTLARTGTHSDLY